MGKHMNRITRGILLTVLVSIFTPTFAQSVPHRTSGDCEEHEIVNSPGDSDGAIVKTEDGHIYEIDEVDRVDSQLWLTGDDVLVCWSTYVYNGHTVTLYTIRNGEDKDDATLLH